MVEDRDATGDRSPDDQTDNRPVHTDVQDEPVNVDDRGVPDAADPQAGMLVEDDSREPDTARDLHPRVGDEIGH